VSAPKKDIDLDEDREASEKAYIEWLNEEAKKIVWDPSDADLVPEDDEELEDE
jgi:hypothetical protein